MSMPGIDPKRLIFVGGLHRSGTTALGRILAGHPDVSGFRDTGVVEDEGQHLQSVYRPAHAHGGPGRFARAGRAHLTEPSPDVAERASRQLLAEWTPHWDLQRRFLVEKSPPNMLMGRYLQVLFPGSALVVIIRHPVVVALSTKKWTRFTSLPSLVEHWLIAHATLRQDLSRLQRVHVLRYEDLVTRPGPELETLRTFLGLGGQLDAAEVDAGRSTRYVERWEQMSRGSLLDRRRRARIIRDFGDAMHAYGYDPVDLTQTGPWALGQSA